MEGGERAAIASPFDYREQTRLYVPRRFPAPNHSGWPRAVAEQILTLTRASRGRALILFTSWRNLEATRAVLERRSNCQLLVQKRGGGHAALLEQFRNTPGAILLGRSFVLGGVDVPAMRFPSW